MTARNMARGLAASVAALLPPGSHRAVYLYLSRFAWSRRITDWSLRFIIPAEKKFDHFVLALNQADPVVSGSLTLGLYEPFESELFARQIASGNMVFDVGANVGYYTALAALAAGPGGRVVAFEPEPTNFATLTRTVARNGFNNVTACQMAIADRSGTGQLYLSTRNGGDHRLYSTASYERSLGVATTTLDEALAQHHLAHVDVLKMDIQGFEGLALRGAEQLLAHRPLKLFLEFYPEGLRHTGVEPAVFLNDLARRGFTLHELDEVGRRLIPIINIEAFVAKHVGSRYSNIYAERT